MNLRTKEQLMKRTFHQCKTQSLFNKLRVHHKSHPIRPGLGAFGPSARPRLQLSRLTTHSPIFLSTFFTLRKQARRKKNIIFP